MFANERIGPPALKPGRYQSMMVRTFVVLNGRVPRARYQRVRSMALLVTRAQRVRTGAPPASKVLLSAGGARLVHGTAARRKDIHSRGRQLPRGHWIVRASVVRNCLSLQELHPLAWRVQGDRKPMLQWRSGRSTQVRQSGEQRRRKLHTWRRDQRPERARQ